MPTESVVTILSDIDVVVARQRGRTMASDIGFHSTDQTIIATAISELARNIVAYAGSGEIKLQAIDQGTRKGMAVVATDKGPGIPDIHRAMQDGYSTGHGLGLGLPGTKRLMDEFDMKSVVGRGTTVTVKKW